MAKKAKEKEEEIIYYEIFSKKISKKQLISILNRSEKTIENRIKECPEIIYSRKSQCYHFSELMPRYIPLSFLLLTITQSISNQTIKMEIDQIISASKERAQALIETHTLSNYLKQFIMIQVAINHQCDISFAYIGYSQEKEIKYVRPYRIFISNGIFYLTGEYTSKNSKNAKEVRTFAINSINGVRLLQYHDTEIKIQEGVYNAFGVVSDKSKKIELLFKGSASIFLKREGLPDHKYDFISESSNGDAHVLVYFNSEQEIISLVQRWMPQISFKNRNDSITGAIIKTIKKNAEQL